jgi:hypothetical protein
MLPPELAAGIVRWRSKYLASRQCMAADAQVVRRPCAGTTFDKVEAVNLVDLIVGAAFLGFSASEVQGTIVWAAAMNSSNVSRQRTPVAW